MKRIIEAENINENIKLINARRKIAERKVKTITQKLKRKLAGGYFSDNSIPYNFKKDYTVIDIQYNTRARAYDKKDKYIIDIIEKGI